MWHPTIGRSVFRLYGACCGYERKAKLRYRCLRSIIREGLAYARLPNGSRVLDVADLRQYIYEQTGRIRTNAVVTQPLYGDTNRHGQVQP